VIPLGLPPAESVGTPTFSAQIVFEVSALDHIQDHVNLARSEGELLVVIEQQC
jgi:hypothetical protein